MHIDTLIYRTEASSDLATYPQVNIHVVRDGKLKLCAYVCVTGRYQIEYGLRWIYSSVFVNTGTVPLGL